MSIGITLDPTKAEQSRIASEHVAAFLAGGGKIQLKAEGETAVNPKDMQAIQDQNWRKAAEMRKEKGVKDDSIKSRGKRK